MKLYQLKPYQVKQEIKKFLMMSYVIVQLHNVHKLKTAHMIITFLIVSVDDTIVYLNIYQSAWFEFFLVLPKSNAQCI